MPGGRHAYIPALNVRCRPRSVRFGRLHAGREAQQAGDVARRGIAGEDLLVHAGSAGAAGGGAGDGLPRKRVGAKELVLGLGHGREA